MSKSYPLELLRWSPVQIFPPVSWRAFWYVHRFGRCEKGRWVVLVKWLDDCIIIRRSSFQLIVEVVQRAQVLCRDGWLQLDIVKLGLVSVLQSRRLGDYEHYIQDTSRDVTNHEKKRGQVKCTGLHSWSLIGRLWYIPCWGNVYPKQHTNGQRWSGSYTFIRRAFIAEEIT